jgi:hypothetical protein
VFAHGQQQVLSRAKDASWLDGPGLVSFLALSLLLAVTTRAMVSSSSVQEHQISSRVGLVLNLRRLVSTKGVNVFSHFRSLYFIRE